MDAFAGIINREGADVVTLQEVFEEDIGALREGLDGDWKVHFATADNKARLPFGWHGPIVPHSAAFGNAVLVRQGGGVESRPVDDEVVADNGVRLDVPGGVVDPAEAESASVPADDIPRDDDQVTVGGGVPYDGEARVAAVAEVTVER